MELIDKLLQKARKAQSGLNGEYFKKIINEYSPEICDINTEEQLYEKGENALGVEIMRYEPYHPYTIEYKRATGQPYNRVTLRDTGDFHSSVRIQADLQGFEIVATDYKTEALVDRYGKILGLTPNNKQFVAREYVRPELLLMLKKLFFNESF